MSSLSLVSSLFLLFVSVSLAALPSCRPPLQHPSPGKGLGVFASYDLEIGTIIMREPAILGIPPPKYAKGTGYPMAEISRLVRAAYERLSKDDQDEFSALTYHAHPGELEQEGSDVLGFIFRTNAYDTGGDISVFPKIARINHSCRPNAAYYWNEKLQKRVIYASRNITRGEEITVSYIPLLLDSSQRQRRLNQYGFACTCSACAQPPQNLSASNERRSVIRQAFNAFKPQLTLDVPTSPALLEKARRNAETSLQLAELVEEEGLGDFYAMAYRVVAITHAKVEDWEKATVWANKGYKIRVMEDPESAYTREMHSLTSRCIENWENQLKNVTGKK
ncbi:SET domain-containing protein [Corynespora cassiicola Philippines]|uniref:SET domain-containing protein n=1 Tax=Corynespora cassiicola Philippines TaxID=1448308 RepID=A0A2T2NVL9_CORCC|nr:SET domain-containing protein [Corynespora cassiicola Philippines]